MSIDSYEKLALDFYYLKSIDELKDLKILKHSRYQDRIELAVRLAIKVSIENEEYADSFRVFPVSMKNEYEKFLDSCCCGFSDEVYRTLSGNYYFIGYNFGH